MRGSGDTSKNRADNQIAHWRSLGCFGSLWQEQKMPWLMGRMKADCAKQHQLVCKVLIQMQREKMLL